MNSFGVVVNPNEVDVSFDDGIFRGMIEGSDSQEALMGIGMKEFPTELYIPESEWDDRIREMDKHESWPENYSVRFTNQSPTHECVYHCRTQCFESTYNRQIGRKFAMRFSPLAGYFGDKGPNGQWGGANVNRSLNLAMSDGMLPEYDGEEWMGGNLGQMARFKHTCHLTSGTGKSHWPTHGWIRSLTEGWRDTSRHFRVIEGFWIPNSRAHVSSIFHGWGVGNGRKGHSIPHLRIVKDASGRYLSKYKDSYDVFRYDTQSLTGGGYCIRQTTMPDDPSKPAGADMKAAA